MSRESPAKGDARDCEFGVIEIEKQHRIYEVVVGQNVQKSVTHAQSCCPKLIAFYRSRLTKTAKQSGFFLLKISKEISLALCFQPHSRPFV